MNKRELAAKLAIRTGAVWLGTRAATRTLRLCPVLAYHRVLDNRDPWFAGDLELISAGVDDFRWQMAYLARHYDPITATELAAINEGSQSPPNRPVLVTFDDGFSDNHDTCLQILIDTAVRATFFVSTDYIDSHRPFWFDWIVAALVQTRREVLTLDSLGTKLRLGEHAVDRRSAAFRLLRTSKEIADSQRLAMLADLEQATGVPCSLDAVPNGRPMTWGQVKELRDAGMDVGSHGATHSILTQLPAEDLTRELLESRAEIEARLHRPCVSLAYPVGGFGAYSDVVQDARATGYAIGFTYVENIARLPLPSAFTIPRIHIERYIGRSRFAARVLAPAFF